MSSHVIKMASKIAMLSETEMLNSGMKKEVFGTFYRTTIRSGKKGKKVMKEYRKTRNDK